MTVVLLSIAQPCAGCPSGHAPASGTVYFRPTLRHEAVDHATVLPTAFAVHLSGTELSPVQVTLEPSPLDNAWVWEVNEKVQNGSVRYVVVPNSVSPVQYASLVEVDWYGSDYAPPPSWQVALTNEIAARIAADDELWAALGAGGSGTIDGGTAEGTSGDIIDGGEAA